MVVVVLVGDLPHVGDGVPDPERAGPRGVGIHVVWRGHVPSFNKKILQFILLLLEFIILLLEFIISSFIYFVIIPLLGTGTLEASHVLPHGYSLPSVPFIAQLRYIKCMYW